ncbi:DMT family transporter [Methylovirgula sp. 4M-Z18]|nr:DMT family transporter [Methylovirgula sp. 4M-Z18]
MGSKDWAELLVLSVLWGGTFFFVKIAGAEIPTFTLVFGRVALAALVLALALPFLGERIPTAPRVWLAFFGMGLLNNVLPFSLIFYGESSMPNAIAASLSAILNATTPLFTVLVAHVLTSNEKLTVRKGVGVLLGFGGVAVMIAPKLFGALADGGNDTPVLAILSCLTAALIYGFAAMFGRRFKAMGVRPLQTAFGQVAASSVILLPVVVLVDQPWQYAAPSVGAVSSLVAMAVASTALAYILYFRVLANAGATNLSLVTFLIPVSAILLSAIFLGERLQWVHVAGVALIGLGLAAIDGRLVDLLKARGAGSRQAPAHKPPA